MSSRFVSHCYKTRRAFKSTREHGQNLRKTNKQTNKQTKNRLALLMDSNASQTEEFENAGGRFNEDRKPLCENGSF